MHAVIKWGVAAFAIGALVTCAAWLAVRGGAHGGRRAASHATAAPPAVTEREAPAVTAVTPPAPMAPAPASAPHAARAPGAAPRMPQMTGLAAMENVARDVCACKDAACADEVQSRYVASLDDHAPLDPRDMTEYLASSRSLRSCVRALAR